MHVLPKTPIFQNRKCFSSSLFQFWALFVFLMGFNERRNNFHIQNIVSLAIHRDYCVVMLFRWCRQHPVPLRRGIGHVRHIRVCVLTGNAGQNASRDRGLLPEQCHLSDGKSTQCNEAASLRTGRAQRLIGTFNLQTIVIFNFLIKKNVQNFSCASILPNTCPYLFSLFKKIS